MKQLFISLFPAVFMASLISLGLCYTSLYLWDSDGFSQNEVILSLCITIPIFLFVTAITFRIYVKKYVAEHSEGQSWGRIFLFLILTTLLCSYFLDTTYYYFDDYIFRAYSKDMINILSDGEKSEIIDEFETTTFFMQTIVQNITGILGGSLIGALSARKKHENY
jgi:hypothetical protein